MEEEYEDKQKVLRERRELEAKLLTAQDQVHNNTCIHFYLHISFFISIPSCMIQMQNNIQFCLSLTLCKCCVRQNNWHVCYLCLCSASQVSHRDVETEKRLRKDLKRTKALLADAQIMLDHLKNNAPSKREIAQLKNQVWTLSHHQLKVAGTT